MPQGSDDSNRIAKSTVRVDFEDGIAWVTLNRPEKRNAMSPTLNKEMLEVINLLEGDERCQVLVLTGEGTAFTAGMDLKEYFRDTEAEGPDATRQAQRDAYGWWRRLRWFEKPTIAMVNGWCFGGGFSPLFACDLAIADEDARFGVSEINWGIIPGGNVTKVLTELMSYRDVMYYTLTGELFDGRRAAELRVVNEAVPANALRERVRAIGRVLIEKNPATLKAAKDSSKRVAEMSVDAAEDYLVVRQESLYFLDKTEGRKAGIRQFIDEKSFKPGLGAYKR